MVESVIKDRPEITADDIRRVVMKQLEAVPDPWKGSLTLPESSSSIERTRVDWVVKLHASMSNTTQRSFDLHRILSDLQRNIESELRTYVTVLLDH